MVQYLTILLLQCMRLIRSRSSHTFWFRGVLFFIATSFLIGCSTISLKSGYSFIGKQSSEKSKRTSCGEVEYYFTGPIRDTLKFEENRLSVYSYILKKPETEHWLSVGPGIILPLPIIPWPFGIVSSLITSDKTSGTIVIAVNFETDEANYTFNPSLVAIKSGDVILTPTSIDPLLTKKSLEPNGSNQYIFAFDLPSYLDPLRLTLNGMSKEGKDILLPELIIEYRRSVFLYWLVGINC